MKSYHRKFHALALLSVCFLVVTGCQSTKTERTSFKKRGDQTFSARSIPPQVVKDRNQIDDSTLLHIGTLSREVDLEQCFGRDCKTFNKASDPTSTLLREAAAKGADVVLLVEDNVRKSSRVTKKGGCLETQTREVQQSYSYSQDGRAMTGSRWIPIEVCVRHARISGEKYSLKSYGYLYRRGEQNLAREQHLTKQRRAAFRKYVAADDYAGLKEALKADPGMAHIRVGYASRPPGMLEDEFKTVEFALIKLAPNALRALLEVGADPADSAWRAYREYVGATWRSEFPSYRIKARHRDSYQRDQKVEAEKAWRCFALLLEHGADANSYNRRGLTLLHVATLEGQPEAVNLLLAHGADKTLQTKKSGFSKGYGDGPSYGWAKDKTAYELGLRRLNDLVGSVKVQWKMTVALLKP